MKLLMHILKKNINLGIDNETLSFREIADKLKEEFYEVIKAINNYNHDKTLLNLKEVVRETFDVIQICILILWRCNRVAKDLDYNELIEEINIEHKDKLISERGWVIQTGIEIDVKE
jgi:NTP pyrophosphatase (non-canonical NTP hydrolase)